MLDDDYGIPIVPYVKGGLAYYTWFQTTDGDVSDVQMGTDAGDKASGASAGLIGTIGISVRAERIDEAAAQGMRESGIAHAGFYGELSIGYVDGFGSASKLSLGDTTWFAGAEFEF
jgi:hypothetical protein